MEVVLRPRSVRVPISLQVDFPPGTEGAIQVYTRDPGTETEVVRLPSKVGEDGYLRTSWEVPVPVADAVYRVRCFIEGEGVLFRLDCPACWSPPPELVRPPDGRPSPRTSSADRPSWRLLRVEWVQRRCFAGLQMGARLESEGAPDGQRICVEAAQRGGSILWTDDVPLLLDQAFFLVPIPLDAGGGPPLDLLARGSDGTSVLTRDPLFVEEVPWAP